MEISRSTTDPRGTPKYLLILLVAGLTTPYPCPFFLVPEDLISLCRLDVDWDEYPSPKGLVKWGGGANRKG